MREYAFQIAAVSSLSFVDTLVSFRPARPRLAAACVLLLASMTGVAQSSAPARAKTAASAPAVIAAKSRIASDFYKQPMSFEPNVGQIPGHRSGQRSLFFSRNGGLALDLDAAEARFEFASCSPKPAPKKTSVGAGGAAITLEYIGADPSVSVSGAQMLLGKHNYIPTGDRKAWHSNVPTYGAVEYRHLYPGVDLSFYGNPDRLEYDFTVAPATDPDQIRLSIGGTQSVSTDSEGNLLLVSNGKKVRFLKPVAYQNLPGGERRPVEAAYRLSRSGGRSKPVIGFTLGEYDHSQPLIIDPVVDYAFYLPATVNGYLYVGASTTDAAGNTYIAGTFPNVLREYGFTQNGFFVAKFNAAGTKIYDTTFGATTFPYFGGSVNGIAVDSTGRIYVTGEVSGAYGGGLPIVNGYQTSAASSYINGFIAVFNSAGSAITYSSYFGANGQGNAIAVDISGNAYIAGAATVTTTAGAAVSTQPPNRPGFVAKFDPSLSGAASLIYSTYLGSTTSGAGTVNGIALDSQADAYVTGNTGAPYATDVYPTTPGAYAYNGRTPYNDVFVTKVNPTGTAFLYSALLGPGSGQAIALDSSDDAYVTGLVYEDDYPTTSGAYQTTYPSGFVTELNPQGSALVYSTFLGGPSDLLGSGASYISPTHMALPPGCASACPVYVAGITNGSDLPLVKSVQSYVPGSTWSGFYMELAGNGGSLLQSSYFASGSGFDPYQQIPGIGVDSSGDIYLAGDVLPLEFPITKPTTGATGEGFLARVIPASGAKLSVSPSSITFPTQIQGVATAQEGFAQPTVTLENLGDEAVTLSAITSSSSVFSQTNNCNGTVPAAGNCILTLNYKPNNHVVQTGTYSFVSSASVNPVLAVTGTGISDRYLIAACGTVTPCSSLAYPDVVVGGAAPAQIVTLTNLGNVTVALSSIVSSLPDYSVLTNCPLSGSGLATGQSCLLSIQFNPTQTGLRSGTVTITSPGVTANTITLAASGTGLLSPNPSSLALLGSTLNFGTWTLGATSTTQTVTVFNNGTAPATVFAPTASTAGDATGVSDYEVTANTCGQLLPEASCTISVTFVPTVAGTRSGTLTIPTSASSTPLASSLTGIGVATKQTLEFDPAAITFPDEVIDASSSAVTASVYNVGPTPVSIDRVLITGSYQLTSDTCSGKTLAIPTLAGADAGCSIQVEFSPTAAGLKTGTVTVVDSEGNQTPLSLTGTGIAQNGALYISPGTINFGTEPVGTTSGNGQFTVTNIGNSPVTVTGATVTGDYSVSPNPAFPWNFTAGEGCCFYLNPSFTPSKVANPDSGTITLTTSAGNLKVNLNGVGEAATKAILLSPPTTASFNFGSLEMGQTTAGNSLSYVVTVYNAGTDPVTIAGLPAISGTNASDFGLSLAGGDGTCGAQTLNPGNSCFLYLEFHPSAAGTRTAVLAVTDNATTGGGTQTLTLTGTGTTTIPAYTFVPNTLAFGPQPVATVSSGIYLNFINNSAAPVTISSVSLSPAGSFTQPGYCTGTTVAANGGKCQVVVYFAPTATGQVNGTATLTDTKGNTYVAQLYGYSAPVQDSFYINPVGLNFAPQPQLSTSGAQYVSVYNHSTQTAVIGQVTLNNAAYKITESDCGSTTGPGGGCQIFLEFSPTASTTVGAQSGTMSIPVTYADGKTATYTVAVAGTVVAPINSAEISPTVLTFLDQPVNTSSGSQTITLTNKSNEMITVGTLTSTNTSSTGPFKLVTGNCGGTVGAGASCFEQIEFAPTTAANGVTGTLTFPITFNNGKTTSLTATYSGNALAAKNSLLITPDSGDFGSAVVGQTGNVVSFQVTNNGNQPVSFGTATLTSTQAGTNFTRNNFDYGSCSNTSLAAGSSCTFNIYFTPSATAVGTINGTLTIADGSATGGPHKIPLVGTGLAATQTIGVSQTAVNFGKQTVGTGSTAQAIYVTNQSASPVSGFTYMLGGTNASDFTLQTNSCGTTILSTNYGGNRQTCALLVSFNPAKASLGARSATVSMAFGGSTGAGIGSPITVTLQGTGVPPAPAVALFPASLSYPAQAIGTRSAAQYFRLYNSGTATLNVTSFGSADATEFLVVSNTCSGTALTLPAGQSCLIGVEFAPSAAGSRSGTIQFTDNANNVLGSKQTVMLTGTGIAVPLVTLSPSSLTFANQNVGTTSATQVVTVSNPGAETLTISSIVKSGSNPADFVLESNSCGSTLASKATCTLTLEFAPTVAGSRTASIVLSDNADNASGAAQPTQTIPLAGTGVGIPSAGVSPSSLNFGSETVGTPSAAMTVQLNNSGTGALAIASIGVSGTNPADFTITNGCGASLAVGAQCNIAVVFKASAIGARTASLVVTDNSGLVAGSTQTVALSGTGTAPASSRP